jgi:hypothetical protein
MLDPRTRSALADGEAGHTDDPEVDELVVEIVETREQMTDTVEEIGSRLDPHNIVEGAKATVREATIGKVEGMADTAGALVNDAGDTVREAGSGIVDTITRNPIPAALVGIGVGWLVLSKRPASRYPSDGSWQKYGAGAGPYRDRSAVETVQRRAGQMADDVGRTVDDVAGQVGRFAGDLPDDVRSTADQIGAQAGQLFQSNPLAVGAIAAAVGTAVGLALPATQAERRAISRPTRQLIAKAQDVATDALDSAEQAARDAEQQARAEEATAKAH